MMAAVRQRNMGVYHHQRQYPGGGGGGGVNGGPEGQVVTHHAILMSAAAAAASVPFYGQPVAPAEVDKPIGYGAFGVVWAVTDPRSGKRIAIKKLPNVFQSLISCKRVYREVKMLCTFRHENVLSAIDIIKPPESHIFNELYVATEWMQSDLHRIIVSPQPLTPDHVKVFIYQILRGLKYLHSANIIHRDIKPGNLLINANCLLKICDFGLARVVELDENASMTHEVVTQYYRAPEILMGARHYTAAVDIWSVGCILAELLSRRILFQAQSPLHQLDLILDLLGTPMPEDLKTVCEQAKQHVNRKSFIPSKLTFLYTLSNDCDFEVVNLLSAMLVFNPEKRVTAANALSHSYLEDGRIRYHSCMCRCCRTPEGIRYTDDAEPVCLTPFHYTFEDDLTSISKVRDKLQKLYLEMQQRHCETLQLNVNSPLYKKFVNSHCALPDRKSVV